MPPSTARTLKGPRRLVRRSARRGPSPRWQFLRGFLKNPVMVGSIIPSSRVLIEKMLGRVDWENTKLFVEYGPGVGTFTRPILEKLGPDATPRDDRYQRGLHPLSARVDRGSAAGPGHRLGCGRREDPCRPRACPSADFVLSGLPFSTLPPGVGDAIAEATSQVVRPGGAFLVYQFSPKVLDFIKPHFDKIDRGFEWINVPPATLFWAWKKNGEARTTSAR